MLKNLQLIEYIKANYHFFLFRVFVYLTGTVHIIANAAEFSSSVDKTIQAPWIKERRRGLETHTADKQQTNTARTGTEGAEGTACGASQA